MGRFGKGSPMVHLHRGKGVPLEGPFLGCFSQGNLTEMNEMRVFGHFRMFCILAYFVWVVNPLQHTSVCLVLQPASHRVHSVG